MAHDSIEAKDAMGSVLAGADRYRPLSRWGQAEDEGASRVVTGALIGGVSGALGGLLLYEIAESELCGSGSDDCDVSPTRGVTILVGAAVGAAVGAVIGALSDSRERQAGPLVPGFGVLPRHGRRLHWAVPVGP